MYIPFFVVDKIHIQILTKILMDYALIIRSLFQQALMPRLSGFNNAILFKKYTIY